MKNIILITLFLLPNILLCKEFIIENFNNSREGEFPNDWKYKNVMAKDLYSIVYDKDINKKYITITDRGESVQIGKEISWDIKKFPILKWMWRVKTIPEGAAENKAEKNDSAAGIYVIFKNAWFVMPRVIKYVWSSSLPKGTIIEKGYTRIVIIESGAKNLNKWIHEEINIYEDYIKFFDREPGDPQGIAILTDANATMSIAVADYGSIIASSGNQTKRIIAGE